MRAGVVSRTLADAIDLGIVAVALGAIYLAASAILFLLRPRAFHFPSPSLAFVLTLATVLLFGYLANGWSGTGRTLGKQLVGLRVVNRHGERLRLATASLRALLCLVVPVGLFWSAVSRRNASVQDLIVGSSVIYDWKLRTPPRERSPVSPEAAAART
jgi:uncharacterized RDD family membrane protein YckC